MTIATEINRLQIAKNDIKLAIEAKGVTVGSDLKLDAYPSKIAEIGSVDDYVRPTDWLILPTLLDTDQKFVGLHAIWEDSNFLSLSATGAYTVDWGDGVIENYNSGVQSYHIYDYNSININTLCSRGYKQVIVVVTPQSGNLTNINLNLKHNQSGLQRYASGWLDIRIAGSLSSLNISSSSLPLVSHTNLEIAELRGDNTITAFDYLFYACNKLQYLTTFNTPKGVSFSYMFGSCTLLQTIQLFDTSKGTDFSYMFYGCYSLQTIQLFDTSKGTYFSRMFYGCYSLQTIPLLDTSMGTDFSRMFTNCSSLQTIPLLNTASGTDFSYMFGNCRLLQTIPLLDTSKGTYFNSMFFSCSSLQTIPLLNLFSNTSTALTNMFYICSSLIKGRTNNTNLTISYDGCKLSKTVIVDIFKGLSGGITNTSTAIDSTQTIILVNNGSLLVEGGYAYIWDAAILKPTDDATHEIVFINSIVSNQITITRAQFGTTAKNHTTGRKIGTYIASAQTINITNNWGAAMLSAPERAIATNRGWTITG